VAAEPSPAHVELGLRERKKRETRQRISDLATQMFLERGFDAVRVADIAERVGVSEKTIYNYFPTKESLVFDEADEQLANALRAVTDRPGGVSPTRAYMDELKRQISDLAERDFDLTRDIIPRFGEMMDDAPTLRAAWGDHRHRMVTAVAEVLASDLGVDALDAEPRTAARALVSLTELSFDSMWRNISRAQSGPELFELVEADLERAARLLDTGLWSLSLMIGGRRSAEQLREAAGLAEQARRQVIAALREARSAWRAHQQEQRHGAHRDPRGPERARGRHLRGNGRA
jgi:AcrR family transcriptional regulator